MTEFEDLEGPRGNERELHLVHDESKRVVALASRVEAKSIRRKRDFRKTGSIQVEDGEAHIGDKIWIVLSATHEPIAAYHDEQKARDQAGRDDGIVGVEVKHWSTITHGLYTAEEIEEKNIG